MSLAKGAMRQVWIQMNEEKERERERGVKCLHLIIATKG